MNRDEARKLIRQCLKETRDFKLKIGSKKYSIIHNNRNLHVIGIHDTKSDRIFNNENYKIDLDTMSNWNDGEWVIVPDEKARAFEEFDIKALEEQHSVKISRIENSNYVTVKAICPFCRDKFESIQYINHIVNWLHPVPLDTTKRVCNKCFNSYRLYEKDWDVDRNRNVNRKYGYQGTVNKFVTPMDKVNTLILGLEMEFEGTFNGWKELHDAHKGHAFFGYDGSVDGGNELSWDCGSYSWWKHLSGLKKTCEVLKKYGAKEGHTAGVHIHVSHPHIDNNDYAEDILQYVKKHSVLRTLFEVVSLRKNRERFEIYCSWNNHDPHHRIITGSRRGNTTEFRMFSCSLDHKLLITRLKFVKEFYEKMLEKNTADQILYSFSKAVRDMIIRCGEEQVRDGFVTESAWQALLQKLNVKHVQSKEGA